MAGAVVQQQANSTSGSLTQQLTSSKHKTNNEQIKDIWAVPTLPTDFDLDQALSKALVAAGSYMNKVLLQDDMMVEMQHDNKQIAGVVKDIVTGKEVSRYAGTQMLKLFAKHYQQTGVVVDGKV